MTREEVLEYGLSFPLTYQEAPFHDPNWQLVRVKGSKKVFLWTYEREGCLNINVKLDPQWKDFWRSAYPGSVVAGYHQNKEHWNTLILDGTIPEEDVKRMIAESYELLRTVRQSGSMKQSRRFRRGMWLPMRRLRSLQVRKRWQGQWEMPCIRIRIRKIFPASAW